MSFPGFPTSNIKTYRSLPVYVEAVQYKGKKSVADLQKFLGEEYVEWLSTHLEVRDGHCNTYYPYIGDWIYKYSSGEVRIASDANFHEIFEPC